MPNYIDIGRDEWEKDEESDRIAQPPDDDTGGDSDKFAAAPIPLMLKLLNRALFRMLQSLAISKQIDQINDIDPRVVALRKEFIELTKWYSMSTMMLIKRDELRRDRRINEIKEFPLSAFNDNVAAQQQAILGARDIEFEDREHKFMENLGKYIVQIRDALKLKEQTINHIVDFLNKVQDHYPFHGIKPSFLLYHRPVLGLYSQMDYSCAKSSDVGNNTSETDSMIWTLLTPELQNELRLIRLKDGLGWIYLRVQQYEFGFRSYFRTVLTEFVLHKSAPPWKHLVDRIIENSYENQRTDLKITLFIEAIETMKKAVEIAQRLFDQSSPHQEEKEDMLREMHMYEAVALCYVGLLDSLHQHEQHHAPNSPIEDSAISKEDVQKFVKYVQNQFADVHRALAYWLFMNNKIKSTATTNPPNIVDRFVKEMNIYQRDEQYLSLLFHCRVCDYKHLLTSSKLDAENYHAPRHCCEFHSYYTNVSDNIASTINNVIEGGFAITSILKSKMHYLENDEYSSEELAYFENQLSSTTSTWHYAKESMFWATKALQISLLRKDCLHFYENRETRPHDLQHLQTSFSESDWLRQHCARYYLFAFKVRIFRDFVLFRHGDASPRESSFMSPEDAVEVETMASHDSAETTLKKAAFDWDG
jgi:hypothetical protein